MDLDSLIEQLQQEIAALHAPTERVMGLISQIKDLDRDTLVRLYYRFFAEYDQHMEVTNHYPRLREALQHMKDYIHGPLLDVSCGTGEALLYLSDYLREKKNSVTANDYSEDMLAKAKKKLRRKRNAITFTTHDVRQLPWKEQFQSVLCSQSIHFFPRDKKQVLDRIIGAIQPGGYFLLIDEWPSQASSSPHLSPWVRLLLEASNEPLHYGLDVRKGEFERVMLRPLYGLRWRQGHGMAIDHRHWMYGLVYQKPG